MPGQQAVLGRVLSASAARHATGHTLDPLRLLVVSRSYGPCRHLTNHTLAPASRLCIFLTVTSRLWSLRDRTHPRTYSRERHQANHISFRATPTDTNCPYTWYGLDLDFLGAGSWQA